MLGAGKRAKLNWAEITALVGEVRQEHTQVGRGISVVREIQAMGNGSSEETGLLGDPREGLGEDFPGELAPALDFEGWGISGLSFGRRKDIPGGQRGNKGTGRGRELRCGANRNLVLPECH